LIRGAEKDFTEFLAQIPFHEPQRPVLFNVIAASESDPDKIKELMARQLCSPVRWYDSVCRMQAEEIRIFAEVGPKKVLSGILRKIIPDTYEHEVYNVDGMKGLETFLKAVT
jgi:[acyl-carrier-protein] S-malonyltransferase